MGKLFVVFEELPTFSKEQWKGGSSKLKTLTTEKMSVFWDLFEKPFQASNLLNFQNNTNKCWSIKRQSREKNYDIGYKPIKN